jgi:hypothetical protein
MVHTSAAPAVGSGFSNATKPAISERRPRASPRRMSSRSELDAQARGRVDRLGHLVAVRKAAIDVRDHHAGVEVDALDRPTIDQERNEVGLAGALAAVEACNGETVSVWLEVGGVGGDASRGEVVGLLRIASPETRRNIA